MDGLPFALWCGEVSGWRLTGLGGGGDETVKYCMTGP